MICALIIVLIPIASPSSADDLKPILAQYQSCIGEAREKASKMKTDALKEKIFMGRLKSCDRQRDAQITLIEVDQEFAQITESLITNARKELGL